MCLNICYLILVLLDFISTHIALEKGLKEKNFVIVWIRDRWSWVGHLIFSFGLGLIYISVVHDTSLLTIMNVILALIVLRNFWSIYGRS